MLRHVLLALLANDEPAHGYALMKTYRGRMGVQLSIGNVYRELQRLTMDGLIAIVENPPGADVRRAPYGLTAGGRRALAAWLATPLEPGRFSTDELACRLAVVADMTPVEAIGVLQTLRNQLWDFAKSIERERAQVAASSRDPRKLFVARDALLARQAMQVAADIAIVEELLGTVTPKSSSGEAGRRSAGDGSPTAQPSPKTSRRR